MKQSTSIKNLYTKSNIDNCELTEVVTDVPHLEPDKSIELEGVITLEEASLALRNMKNDKSPGSDGFSAECLKCFWSRIEEVVVRALNYSFRKGKLSNVQCQGVITCISEGDKPRHYIKNGDQYPY